MLKAGMNELYTAPVPIIAMVSGVARESVLTAGANDIVSRPFMPKELEAVLDRWLSK
jgi:DNA-binding response OmpR family regulator